MFDTMAVLFCSFQVMSSLPTLLEVVANILGTPQAKPGSVLFV
jgi:hypothetical protein